MLFTASLDDMLLTGSIIRYARASSQPEQSAPQSLGIKRQTAGVILQLKIRRVIGSVRKWGRGFETNDGPHATSQPWI